LFRLGSPAKQKFRKKIKNAKFRNNYLFSRFANLFVKIHFAKETILNFVRKKVRDNFAKKLRNYWEKCEIFAIALPYFAENPSSDCLISVLDLPGGSRWRTSWPAAAGSLLLRSLLYLYPAELWLVRSLQHQLDPRPINKHENKEITFNRLWYTQHTIKLLFYHQQKKS